MQQTIWSNQKLYCSAKLESRFATHMLQKPTVFYVHFSFICDDRHYTFTQYPVTITMQFTFQVIITLLTLTWWTHFLQLSLRESHTVQQFEQGTFFLCVCTYITFCIYSYILVTACMCHDRFSLFMLTQHRRSRQHYLIAKHINSVQQISILVMSDLVLYTIWLVILRAQVLTETILEYEFCISVSLLLC